MIFCRFYDAAECRSCTLLELAYPQQLELKQQELHQILDPFQPVEWLAPVTGALSGFRNKAKMVATSSAQGIVLGLANGTSLIECPLYDSSMQRVLRQVENWLNTIGVKAYDVKRKSGELKYVLLSHSTYDDSMMLRFVLRSTDSLDRLRNALKILLDKAPELKVISVNLQPVHMAILEGDEEIFLTELSFLQESFNNIPLFIRPKSFFQTNPQVAARLYQTAADWVETTQAKSIMDLFCGVGGFALHVANNNRQVTGIEIEEQAIACAVESARRCGINSLDFKALDAVSYSIEHASPPDLLIVNPPRRGLGQELCEWIEGCAAQHIIYSSCNAVSLGRDLAALKSYALDRVQLFDMFPHTRHFETLVFLRRSTGMD